jgi:hypothetical protein
MDPRPPALATVMEMELDTTETEQGDLMSQGFSYCGNNRSLAVVSAGRSSPSHRLRH